MPIKQDRMLSLLAAARDYQLGLEKFFEMGQDIRGRVANNELTAKQALDLLIPGIRPELLLRFPYESPTVIMLESRHFAKERKRNERKAQKLRENRQAARLGLPRPERGNGAASGPQGAARIAAKLDDIRPLPSATAALPGEAESELDQMIQLDPGFAPETGIKSDDPMAGETLRQQMEFLKALEEEATAKPPSEGGGK